MARTSEHRSKHKDSAKGTPSAAHQRPFDVSGVDDLLSTDFPVNSPGMGELSPQPSEKSTPAQTNSLEVAAQELSADQTVEAEQTGERSEKSLEAEESCAESSAAEAPKKKKAPKIKWVFNLLILLCFAVFAVCAFLLGRWIYENNQADKLAESLAQAAENSDETEKSPDGQQVLVPDETDTDIASGKQNYLNINFDPLLEKNSQTVGWIKINGTRVNYPVVQCGDNDYYLRHNFSKQYTNAGWIFADYQCDLKDLTNNRNLVIYGHGRRDFSMFGSLEFCREDWWLENPSYHVLRISTPTQNTVWQVFSVYTTALDFYYIQTDFSTDTDFLDLVAQMKARSIHDFGVEITAEDTILTLSTCTVDADRLVVQAKLIQIETKTQ